VERVQSPTVRQRNHQCLKYLTSRILSLIYDPSSSCPPQVVNSASCAVIHEPWEVGGIGRQTTTTDPSTNVCGSITWASVASEAVLQIRLESAGPSKPILASHLPSKIPISITSHHKDCFSSWSQLEEIGYDTIWYDLRYDWMFLVRLRSFGRKGLNLASPAPWTAISWAKALRKVRPIPKARLLEPSMTSQLSHGWSAWNIMKLYTI